MESRQISEARNGNISIQKELFENCKKISLPITLQFLHQARKLNISFEDLRNLTSNAFFKAITNYDDERSEFYNYFKYIYMMECRSAIRKQAYLLDRGRVPLLTDDIESNYELQFNSPNRTCLEKEYSIFDKEKILELIEKDKTILTPSERIIILHFLDGKNLKEISLTIERNYTETVRRFKKAINKLKKYLLNA